MIRNSIIAALIIIAGLSISCRSAEQSGTNGSASVSSSPSLTTATTATAQPTAQKRSAAESVAAAKEILRTSRLDDELNNVRGNLAGIPADAPEYEEARRLLVKLDAQIQRKQREQEAPKRARLAAEAEALRGLLQEEYRKIIVRSNPFLNFIRVKLTKTGGTSDTYSLWAVHTYFNQYSFQAGDNAHIVRQWMTEHREKLGKALIYCVGLMGDDKFSGACYFNLE